MNNPFRRRAAVADPSSLEAGVRDILSDLRAQTDIDCAKVLSHAVNTYLHAIGTFRGSIHWGPEDITAIFGIWEILLNASRSRVQAVSEFAPKNRAEAPANDEQDEEDEQ